MRRTFIVRRAVPADLDGIRRVEWAAAREKVLWGEVPTPKAEIAKRIGPLAFVAVAQGKVVGHAYGVLRRANGEAVFRRGERYVEVDAVYVQRGWRGRGVGTAVLRRVLREARRRGFRRFYVYTANKHLPRAMNFYRRAGFRPWYATFFI